MEAIPLIDHGRVTSPLSVETRRGHSPFSRWQASAAGACSSRGHKASTLRRRSHDGYPHLVAHATKHGSTSEVAEAIAAALREAELAVDVVPAADVDGLDGYAAVVLGGALYTGRWHRDAVEFLERHRRCLAPMPLAVFALGPKTLAGADVASSRAQLDKAIARFPDLEPAAVAIFGGVVDPGKLRFPFSRMPASDARDWDAIRAWADEIAQVCLGAGQPAPV